MFKNDRPAYPSALPRSHPFQIRRDDTAQGFTLYFETESCPWNGYRLDLNEKSLPILTQEFSLIIHQHGLKQPEDLKRQVNETLSQIPSHFSPID